jgi:hypothetical protein
MLAILPPASQPSSRQEDPYSTAPTTPISQSVATNAPNERIKRRTHLRWAMERRSAWAPSSRQEEPDKATTPPRQQNNTTQRQQVGDGASIGMGAVLLSGSSVGDGAILAAGSVLPKGKSVPPREVWAGSPAVKAQPVLYLLTQSPRRCTAPAAHHPVSLLGCAAQGQEGANA